MIYRLSKVAGVGLDMPDNIAYFIQVHYLTVEKSGSYYISRYPAKKYLQTNHHFKLRLQTIH